jgi:hypothetical protein
MCSAEPGNKNDCPAEGQQQFTWPTNWTRSELWTEKYGYVSSGAQNQEWLCWWRPAAIYLEPKETWVGSGQRQSHDSVRVERQKNMVVGPTGLRTKNDWWRRPAPMYPKPSQVRSVSWLRIESSETEKYGGGSLRAWSQEWLCWWRLVPNYQTRLYQIRPSQAAVEREVFEDRSHQAYMF